MPTALLCFQTVIHGFLKSPFQTNRPLVLALSCLLATNVHAGSPSPESLQSVWQAVMAKQPDKQALPQFDALSSRYLQAGDSWFANGVNLTVRHENDALTDNTGFKSWESGVDFDLSLNQRQSYQQLGESYQQHGERYAKLLQWQAAALTRQLVWELKRAEVQWQRLQQNQGLIAALADKVSASADSGEVPKMDAVLVQKERLSAEKQTLAAYNVYQQRLAAYQYWSGFDSLPLQIEESVPAQNGDLNALLAQHPQWQWAEQQLQQAEAQQQVTLVQAQTKPNVFVGAKSEEDDATAARTSLIVQMRLPLGKSASYQTTQQEQQQAVSAQQIALQKTRQQLHSEVMLAQQALQQEQALLTVSRQQREVSAEALSMAEQAYSLGETPIQTLLQVQSQMLQALLDEDLQVVAVGQAKARLRQALGLGLEWVVSAS
ncbi:TolC family protein [Thiomicrorhabdus cannonii]|uniref:TolC family protein n=1 Tax=Thiomicrorhabdus cannonii TaxID=2748011 RepID=UPI0015B80D39|nr:TolC family protein [Thiomicrorhabdus cannonii]